MNVMKTSTLLAFQLKVLCCLNDLHNILNHLLQVLVLMIFVMMTLISLAF